MARDTEPTTQEQPWHGKQWCGRCEHYKDSEDFSPSNRGKRGTWCKPCRAEYMRDRRVPKPRASAVIANCSDLDCEYLGTLTRGMCPKHYAQRRRKMNTVASQLSETDMMICRSCEQETPLSEFYKDRNAKGGYKTRCKSCCNLAMKEWRARNVERQREKEREYRKRNPVKYNPGCRKNRYMNYGRNARLIKEFGIVEAEYDAKWEAQGRQCEICGRQENSTKDRRMPVDHDHTTGRTRGIICGNCNAGIGLFDEDIDIMSIAAAYLLQGADVLNS